VRRELVLHIPISVSETKFVSHKINKILPCPGNPTKNA